MPLCKSLESLTLHNWYDGHQLAKCPSPFPSLGHCHFFLSIPFLIWVEWYTFCLFVTVLLNLAWLSQYYLVLLCNMSFFFLKPGIISDYMYIPKCIYSFIYSWENVGVLTFGCCAWCSTHMATRSPWDSAFSRYISTSGIVGLYG